MVRDLRSPPTETVAAGDFPAVGDWVAARPPEGDGQTTIVAVLPRRTVFSRSGGDATRREGAADEQVVAANVDTVFLVVALGHDLNLRRLERYLATSWESGAEPVVVVTKTDLYDDVPARLAEIDSVAFGVPVHPISNVTGEGVEELRRWLAGSRTVALLGSSGVGKSSLVNRVGEEIEVGAGDLSDGRGRHTTTHRELFLLPGGGLVLDTPGMRVLELWEADAGLATAFADVEAVATMCRFSDCGHDGEPGCAVLAALADGTLDPERVESYEKLQRELAFLRGSRTRERHRTNAANGERSRESIAPGTSSHERVGDSGTRSIRTSRFLVVTSRTAGETATSAIPRHRTDGVRVTTGVFRRGDIHANAAGNRALAPIAAAAIGASTSSRPRAQDSRL